MIYIIYHIAHMHGTLVFAKALLCLGRCLIATQRALWYFTQNPGSSAYTQQWVLYTWDDLIISISQVGKPLHEFEEDLSRSSFIL